MPLRKPLSFDVGELLASQGTEVGGIRKIGGLAREDAGILAFGVGSAQGLAHLLLDQHRLALDDRGGRRQRIVGAGLGRQSQ